MTPKCVALLFNQSLVALETAPAGPRSSPIMFRMKRIEYFQLGHAGLRDVSDPARRIDVRGSLQLHDITLARGECGYAKIELGQMAESDELYALNLLTPHFPLATLRKRRSEKSCSLNKPDPDKAYRSSATCVSPGVTTAVGTRPGPTEARLGSYRLIESLLRPPHTHGHSKPCALRE